MSDDTNSSNSPTEETSSKTRSIQIANIKNHTVAVMVAILLAIGLLALGVVLFGEDETRPINPAPNVGTENGANTEDGTPGSQDEVDVTSPVEPTDIDQEIEAINQDIEAFDDSDFNESELSDENLGL